MMRHIKTYRWEILAVVLLYIMFFLQACAGPEIVAPLHNRSVDIGWPGCVANTKPWNRDERWETRCARAGGEPVCGVRHWYGKPDRDSAQCGCCPPTLSATECQSALAFGWSP